MKCVEFEFFFKSLTDAKFEPIEERFVRHMPQTACSNASEHYRVKLFVAGALANCQGY